MAPAAESPAYSVKLKQSLKALYNVKAMKKGSSGATATQRPNYLHQEKQFDSENVNPKFRDLGFDSMIKSMCLMCITMERMNSIHCKNSKDRLRAMLSHLRPSAQKIVGSRHSLNI